MIAEADSVHVAVEILIDWTAIGHVAINFTSVCRTKSL